MPKRTVSDQAPPAGPAIPDWLLNSELADEEIRLYLMAARRCGLEVSHWARSTLNAAARAILDIDEDH